MKERFIFVDIMKGWAMLTIVIFHANNSTINGNLGQLMGNPWNVPIFFIIAGFFLKTEKMQNPVAFMKHKLKGLYLPATVIYLMAVLMHNCCIDFGWYPLGQPHPGNGIPFSFYGIKETITGCVKVLLCAGSGELTMGAMWFLYTLIYAFAAMSLIYWCINKMIDPKVLSGGVNIYSR